MRINKYLAGALGVSRREADDMVEAGRVSVDGQTAVLGQEVKANNIVALDDKPAALASKIYLVVNKPAGCVSSRKGQGSKTVYELLPSRFNALKSAGRLDKDSSGVLLMTNDGDFSHRMTHPKFKKVKEYEVELDKPLKRQDMRKIEDGLELEDGPSHLKFLGGQDKQLKISMSEGRNRQIRRTFSALGYEVTSLHRTRFGPYGLEGLKSGGYKEVEKRQDG